MAPSDSTFPTTSWTLIFQSGQPADPAAAQARERLFATYWPPVYSYLRRRGLAHADAEDATQSFFARFIANDGLIKADPARGRFRSYLLRSVANHAASTWQHDTAARRDTRRVLALDSLALADAENLLCTQTSAPEDLFDLAWAREHVRAALAALKTEWSRRGRTALFDALRRSILTTPAAGDYARLGDALGITEGAVKVEIFRLRRRFREVLRASVATTVDSAADVDEELRYLGAKIAAHADDGL